MCIDVNFIQLNRKEEIIIVHQLQRILKKKNFVLYDKIYFYFIQLKKRNMQIMKNQKKIYACYLYKLQGSNIYVLQIVNKNYFYNNFKKWIILIINYFFKKIFVFFYLLTSNVVSICVKTENIFQAGSISIFSISK